MTMNEDFTRGFFNTLVILRSYLSEIVIGGGWAPFLYYRYLVGDRNQDTVLEVQKGLHAEALRYVSILVENTLELVIDDVGTMKDGPPIIAQVPTPAAYIFQKGLSFTRRRDKQKASKDLYYIFDILAGLPGLQDKMSADFETFSNKHAEWYRKFLSNITTYFKSPASEGSLRIVEQRPADAFPGLDDDQLKHHAFGTLEQFILNLSR